ncbi:MAG: hypothetical protein KIG68_04585 [Oxalobacter sp.]|nr:hypothetical protein [Oxalobacter sp.]
MIYRFKENVVYGGEELHGGCGFMERHKIMILKRTKHWIIYKPQFRDKILKAKRGYISGWGDYIIVPDNEHDYYHAYGVEPGIEAFPIRKKPKWLKRYIRTA